MRIQNDFYNQKNMKATPMTPNESLRSDYDEMMKAHNAYKKQKLQFENRLYWWGGKFFMHCIELLCILAAILVLGMIIAKPRQAGEEPAMIVIEMCSSLPDTGVLSH